MGKVSIVKTEPTIKHSLHTAVELIGGLHSFIQKTDHVLIKPNLNDFDCITNINLIEALIHYLYDHQINTIIIAESTFGNQHITEKHFRASGYYEVCEKYSLPLVNLNNSEVVIKKVEHPLAVERIAIAKEVCEAAKIINVPVMKVHYATGVTLGLKNLKGFLPPDEKKHFHAIGLDKAIVDLNNTIPVDLTIIDGTYCMERMGPKGGDVFHLGLLLAGECCAEADYVAGRIMGYGLHEVKHLHTFIESNKIDIHAIEVKGEELAEVVRPFKKVKLESIIPENITMYNRDACSACMNALLLSFTFISEKIKKPVAIYMGSNNEEPLQQGHTVVAFGNCCKGINADIKIKGCPPYPLLLRNTLGDGIL